ncbi:MAG: D-alanine--D-alanine ligase family protein [Candidatus Aminicenantia bacterium]
MLSTYKFRFAVTYNEILKRDSKDIKEVKDVALKISEILSEDFEVGIVSLKDDIFQFIKELKEFSPHSIFNICEAFKDKSWGEMHVASIYELLEIPYTGSPPFTMGICLNKLISKKILLQSGLPAPPGFSVDEIEKIDESMFPLIIKPISEDGSYGIFKENVVFEKRELKNKLERALEIIKVPMFLEKYIDGRELNVSFLGNEPLCIGEIIFKIYPRILTYNGKWHENSEEDLGTIPDYPAKIEENEMEKILNIARKVYDLFGLKDYARIDMRMDENGNIYIIDINPNPDLSQVAGFARALEVAGIGYEEGIKRIAHFSLKRGGFLNL